MRYSGFKWGIEIKERKKDYNRQYKETKKDAISCKEKIYYEENKEHIAERNKEYKVKNSKETGLNLP